MIFLFWQMVHSTHPLLYHRQSYARTLSPDPSGGILSFMNTLENFAELARAVRDLIRIGVVSETDTEQAFCRVQTGELVTNWLTPRARVGLPQWVSRC
jgi:hypothetical protein